jgi:hypothetical protein
MIDSESDEYNQKIGKCVVPFDRAIFRIISNLKENSIKLEIKPETSTGEDLWNACFTIN